MRTWGDTQLVRQRHSSGRGMEAFRHLPRCHRQPDPPKQHRNAIPGRPNMGPEEYFPWLLAPLNRIESSYQRRFARECACASWCFCHALPRVTSLALDLSHFKVGKCHWSMADTCGGRQRDSCAGTLTPNIGSRPGQVKKMKIPSTVRRPQREKGTIMGWTTENGN